MKDKPRPKSGARPKRESASIRGKVKAHDPFELIRWLALSQPDPRKALAELVQNSLDAGARKITIQRVREKGVACLRIHDDGVGVIPEMERRDALHFIATNIGHSRKRSLSPQERLKLMTQGQYGIGLLGFWSLGETLEMRTAVAGQKAHKRVLHRDRPDFVIEGMRGRLPLEERWTEIVVLNLNREAQSALSAGRAADYLAAELRGQLLARDVEVRVIDRISRGRARKQVLVRPPQFLGERLEGLGPLEVPGHAPIRLDVYLRAAPDGPDGDRGLGVYSVGTLVAESFQDLASLGLDRAPWTDARLTGIVDFPDFRVAPGSRRGVLPDEAATAFATALRTIEPALNKILESLEQQRLAQQDRTLIKDLQKAFRDFHKRRPRYAMLPVRDERDVATAAPDGTRAAGGAGEPAAVEDIDDLDSTEAVNAPLPLLPPGPLHAVRLSPAALKMERDQVRKIRAEAVDDNGRRIETPVTFQWSIRDVEARILGHEGREGDAVDRVSVQSVGELGAGVLRVLARSADREAQAEAALEVLHELPGKGGEEGIPKPEFVDEPGAPWRSRMQEGRWQVNTAHRDFREIIDQPALKLRYLAMLFGKEIVQQSHNDARLAEPLEQLVEVAAFADRRLTPRRGKSAKGKEKSPVADPKD